MTKRIIIIAVLSILINLSVFGGQASDALKKGEDLINKGEVEQAIQEFRRAVAAEPKSKSAERAQYLISVYTVDVFAKIVELKTFLDKYPGSELREEVIMETGRMYYLIDKYEDSSKYFSQYCTEFKDKGKYLDEAYYWLGQINLVNKKYDEAIRNYNIVIENYPNSDFILFAKLQVALTYIKTGNYMEARKILEKIWLLNDNFKGLIDEYLDLIPEENKENSETETEMYGIQCGAFSKRENAFKYQEDLKKKNYGEVFVQKDGDLYKVIIGYFSSLEETNKLAGEISEKERIRVTIVKKKQ